jgi:hypothetical protein
MSIAAMSLAWKQKIPPAMKLVLLAICDHADHHGRCWPSVDHLAQKIGIDRRQVQRHLADLRRLGLIVPIDYESGGRGQATVYEIRLQKDDTSVALLPDCNSEKDGVFGRKRMAFSAERVAFTAGKDGVFATPTIMNQNEPQKNPSNLAAKPRGESLFSNEILSKTKSERPKDEAFEIFCAEFNEHRTIPYAGTTGDHVQLAGLRRQVKIETRDTPPGWVDAIHNYFGTPMSKYTLADLCTRFDVFLQGPLDRFGKPVEATTNAEMNPFSGPKYTLKQPR